MKQLVWCLISCLLWGYCYGQTKQHLFIPDTLALANPWTNQPFPSQDSIFQFAVISDLTGGYRYHGAFEQAVTKIKRLVPDFVMSVGDLIEGYTEDQPQVLRWWEQFDNWVNRFECPFFYVPGNHDLTNPGMTKIYEERYGRTYYHFIYQNVLFLVLSTEDGNPGVTGGPGNMGQEQIQYFKKVLNEHQEVKWTLLFMHRPLWYEDEPGFDAMELLLKDRKYTVFAGHAHVYQKEKRHGRDYFTFATTGGGSGLSGPDFGEFDEVAWVTMMPSGPKVANIMLNGLLEEDVLTAANKPIAQGLIRSSKFNHLPVLYDGKEQDTFETALLIKNSISTPIHFQASFFQHPVFRISRSSFDTVIAPGLLLEIPLKLVAPTKINSAKQDPILLQWTMTTQVPEKTWQLSGTYPISLQPILSIAPAPTDLNIDGHWREWGRPQFQIPEHLDYYPSTWHGPADLSFDVKLARDEKNLYVALQVQDDSLLYNPFRSSWEQEGAEMNLTLSNQKTIKIGFSPGVEPDQQLLDVQENWPKEGQIASRRLPNGFIAEIAIPLSYMQQLLTNAPDHLELQWFIYDHDGMEDQYKGTKAYWSKDTRHFKLAP